MFIQIGKITTLMFLAGSQVDFASAMKVILSKENGDLGTQVAQVNTGNSQDQQLEGQHKGDCEDDNGKQLTCINVDVDTQPAEIILPFECYDSDYLTFYCAADATEPRTEANKMPLLKYDCPRPGMDHIIAEVFKGCFKCVCTEDCYTYYT